MFYYKKNPAASEDGVVVQNQSLPWAGMGCVYVLLFINYSKCKYNPCTVDV